MGTLAELLHLPTHVEKHELIGIAEEGLELARGIEPPTCGLQNLLDPFSDNLTPQETTNHDCSDMGQDGACLSCPGSSVVAALSGDEQG